MKSLSQRELRNRSGAVLRAVEAGESFVITNNGREVGKLVPIGQPTPELAPDRPASVRGGFSGLELHVHAESTDEALRELRAER